jgi:bifunctional DNA-binding transcriptional regulator/antitoxin component of YhaV-PrlF toxin-antitoxin module
MYFSIAPSIRRRLGIKAGDRMIVETDGKQLYCVPLRLEELIRLVPKRRKRAQGAKEIGLESNNKKGRETDGV